MFELVDAFSTIFHGVVNPNLWHVPGEILAEEINTLGNKQGDAHEENFEFFASAGFDYKARLLAHAVDFSVKSERKNQEDKSKHLPNEGLVHVVQSQGHTAEIQRSPSHKKEKDEKPAQKSKRCASVAGDELEPVHYQVVGVKES